ncbi:phytoene desaturase family protein [Crenothrix sp.]|uniref:phytoene desaturase family protein n=1 Tax=Crenothrix sp. TaxID=3100433 RepID=UPI00374CE43F
MPEKKHIVIVGAGPGGLCAGMLLSQRGFKVSIFDKNAEVGGRNRPIRLNGHVFDTGPTFLLMKHVLDDMFALCGKRSSDYLEFFKLDPMYRLMFDDQSVDVYSDREKMRAELQRAFPEGSAGFDRYIEEEGKRFRKLYPCIKRNYSSISAFFSWELIKALPYLALNHSVFSNLGRYFKAEKMRLIFSFQSKYLGMSPWECPALFTMLSYLEHEYGIYHVKGGLNRIAAAMAKVITEQGGHIHTSAAVQSLIIDNKVAKGVRLQDGTEITADEVIINADFAYAMSQLVKPNQLKQHSPERLKRMEYSCSTFMLYLALDTRYDLPHHTIVFADDYKTNISNIFHNKKLNDDFSFYVQNACVTDTSLAPEGHSTLYILVPMPNNNSHINWDEQCASMREKVLDMVAERFNLGDIRSHIAHEKIITPQNWENDENVFLGATFSLSHKFSQLLYWRPHNQFQELKQCYLVGGGTHPGSGLPTIYESARISSDLICQKHGVAIPQLDRA